jgi:hypothetical protein
LKIPFLYLFTSSFLARRAFQPVSLKSVGAPCSLAQLLLHFGPTAQLGPNHRPARPGPPAAVALCQPARSPSRPSRRRPPPGLCRSPVLVRFGVRAKHGKATRLFNGAASSLPHAPLQCPSPSLRAAPPSAEHHRRHESQALPRRPAR